MMRRVAELELGLVGDPHLAAVDRLVELAEHRQLPRGVLEGVRVVIFPFEPVVRGFVGRDERAGQAVGERAAAADLDAEGDRQVDRQAVDARRVAEQSVERFEMVAERLPRLFEPGENAAIALVKRAVRRADLEARDDLFDELSLAVWRKAGDDFLVVEDARGDQRMLPPLAV